MDNEKIEIDVNEFENARYQEILNSGKYVELKILVGTKKETFEGKTGILPCVRMELHNANPETIGILYATLESFKNHLEEEYPLECIASKLLHNTKEVGAWEVPVEQKKSKKKKE